MGDADQKEASDPSNRSVPWLRPARISDAAEIARIHVESWQAAYRGLIADTYLDALDIASRAAEWVPVLEAAREHIIVAERPAPETSVSPNLAGFFQLGKTRDADLPASTAELYLIYVEPQSWRTGLGRTLMQHAIETAKAMGFDAISLWTVRDREASNRFYLAQGFRADVEAQTPCWRDAPDVATRRYLRDTL